MNNSRETKGSVETHNSNSSIAIPQASPSTSEVHDEESIGTAAGQTNAHMSYQHDFNY